MSGSYPHLQQKGNARQSVSLEQVLLFAVENQSHTAAYTIYLTQRLYNRNKPNHRMEPNLRIGVFYNAFAQQQENKT